MINKGVSCFNLFGRILNIFLLCFVIECSFCLFGFELMFIINICVLEFRSGWVVLFSGVGNGVEV